ncbi:GNAT family N-acetyltransferase [Paraliobacillus quinghaiensis]|uniref:GNAT family N-acetyltransferase n=1 Tax=Paraliobacillus quinghaiensis TaxID=470815 RepID=A0A917TY57_9BACI|nr:GNAT family N-acetyltransferase [Paraliobacillus quinghaiensis]GGM41285.1 GNAT family N-acetyltransferase [Paraliobacillus quinghaiensis]
MVVEFIDLKPSYVNEAIELVLSSYQDEKKSVPFLPHETQLLGDLKDKVLHLFHNGSGVLAIDNHKLVGFIAGYLINDSFFGKNKGVYVPLFGHGVSKRYKSSLYEELYKYSAGKWVKRSYTSHAITCFAHEHNTINNWFWLGFGLRGVDGLRRVQSIPYNNGSMIEIKKSTTDDIIQLAKLHREHNLYYRTSPIFMPNAEEDPVDDLIAWSMEENRHIWIAYKDKKPVGYMRIQPTAENFISDHPEVMNITGAYVFPDERGIGVGLKLINEIQDWLKLKEYSLCGVDFEAFNTTGRSFWNKHFTPYTYSMVRRVDERITEIEFL